MTSTLLMNGLGGDDEGSFSILPLKKNQQRSNAVKNLSLRNVDNSIKLAPAKLVETESP